MREEAAKYGATTESSLFNESAKRDYDVQGNGYEFNLGQIKFATLNITGDCFLLQKVLDLPAGQLPPNHPSGRRPRRQPREHHHRCWRDPGSPAGDPAHAQAGSRSRAHDGVFRAQTLQCIYLSIEYLYVCSMSRRTTIDIDDILLARAQAALGTTGLKDRVDAALRAAVR
ncbi:putative lipoprotein lprR [Mycobacterium tuberculosis]|nr:putative lipoprotein lprR [Mycobacterium tuberculosis]